MLSLTQELLKCCTNVKIIPFYSYKYTFIIHKKQVKLINFVAPERRFAEKNADYQDFHDIKGFFSLGLGDNGLLFR